MKNLKLFALIIVMTIVVVSCSSTAESNAEAAQQHSEQIRQSDILEAAEQEAVEEAVIEEEGMQAEEQEMEQEIEQEGDVKPQSPTIEPAKEMKPTKVDNKPTTKEIETPKPTSTSSTTNSTTTSKPTKEIRKKEEAKKPITKKTKTSITKKNEKPSHSIFNSLLSKYVTSTGTVNYAGFKSQESTLDEYLKDLADNPIESSWSRNEKMAYWINLYNASTVKLILDNYPTSSIQNINGGKPWDKRWIKSGSKTYTLNEIENSILRPQFKDARIHFAVNCAAQSCPRLMNKAFTASNLNSLLEENARWFINNSTFNDISAKKVEISKIFDWYSSDFGNIIDYLNKYSTTEIKSNAKVTYKEYDWKLNGK